MKCKDIPDQPLLEFLGKLERREILTEGYAMSWGCVWNGVPHSVQHAMPKEIWGREKLVRAKMRSLIDRGLVSGCACGCRGDFELTSKGREQLRAINK